VVILDERRGMLKKRLALSAPSFNVPVTVVNRADQRPMALPTQCVHCGEPVLQVDELAPFEALGAIINGGAMCPRHWSNFAQRMAQSHGLTLLREEEAGQ